MRKLSRTAAVAALAAAVLTPSFAAADNETMTKIAGDGQRLPRQGSQVNGGIARFDPLRVVLRNAKGKPIANAPITFQCKTGGMVCQLTPAGTDRGTLTVNTDANGVASLDRMGGRSMNLYYGNGGFVVVANYFGLQTVFHLAVDPNSGPRNPYIARIVSGDHQRQPRVGEEPYGGTANFGPLTIQVVDRNGRPVPNVRIQYRCEHVACNFGNPPRDTTDSDGRYTLPSVSEYYSAGGFSVVFVGEQLQQVEFHLTSYDIPHAKVTVVKGARLVAVRGDNQRVPRSGNEVPGGIARFAPMAVRLTTPDGKPIPHQPVHFYCGRDVWWACQLTASGAENGEMDIDTDDNGVATLDRMNGNALAFYGVRGTKAMRVSYGAIASITLHFTVTK